MPFRHGAPAADSLVDGSSQAPPSTCREGLATRDAERMPGLSGEPVSWGPVCTCLPLCPKPFRPLSSPREKTRPSYRLCCLGTW